MFTEEGNKYNSMLKRALTIIPLIGLLVFGCSTHKQEVQKEYTELGDLDILPKLNLLDFDLKGDVRSTSEYEYEATLRFGEYEKKEPCLSIIEHLFNAQGMIYEENTYVSNYSSDNSMILLKKSKYQYNADDLLEKIDIYGKSGELVEREVYIYDPNNNCIEKAQGKGDGSWFELRRMGHDRKGRIITYDHDYLDLDEGYSIKFYYDKRGRLFESTDKDSTELTSYKYDKRNNVIEVINYNSNGWIWDKIFYRYKGKREIEMIEFDPIDLSITSTRYEKSAKIVTFFEKGDVSEDCIKYIYNNKNELIEEKYDDGGYQIFKYDNKSNWNFNLLVTKVYNSEIEIIDTQALIKVREITYWN